MKECKESGRTLLETLGMLVVIAVLVIAGILGYNYLHLRVKRQETVKLVTELGVKYQLTPIRANPGDRIPVKKIYPVPTSMIKSGTDLKSPDGDDGRIYLEVGVDTSIFSVFASNIDDGTCSELLESGNYESFVISDAGECNSKNHNGEVVTKEAYQHMTREEKQDIINRVCYKQPICVHFVYGSKCDGGHWYGNACHHCTSDKVEDLTGACCSALNACGVCACTNGGNCDPNTKECVECTTDADCKTEGKRHCNTTKHTCVQCMKDEHCPNGEKCDLMDHICTECKEENGVVWNAKLGICDCKLPKLGLGETCSTDTNCCGSGICQEGKCSECLKHKETEGSKFGACNDPDHPVCKGHKCQACPNPQAEGDECYDVCNGCPSAKGLVCEGGNTVGKCVCSGQDNNNYWSSTHNRCVECLVNFGEGEGACTDPNKPWCDPSGTCQRCQHNYGAGNFDCPEDTPWCDAGVCKTCSEDKSIRPAGKLWDSENHVCVDCHKSLDCPENMGCLKKSCVPCNQEGTGIRSKGRASCYCPFGTTKRIGSTTTSVGYYDGGAWICGTGCGDHTDCGNNEHCSCTGCSGGACVPCPSCTYREKDDATDCMNLTNCPPMDGSSSCREDEEWKDASCDVPCAGWTTEYSCKECLKDNCRKTCRKNGDDCRDCREKCEEDDLSCKEKCKTRQACNNEEQQCLSLCHGLQEGWEEGRCMPICAADEVYVSYNEGANTCGTPSCIKVPSREELVRKDAIYNNKHFYIPLAEKKYRMTHASASRFCKHYGLHLAKVDEACAKDYAYDSGWDCPNFVSVKQFDDRGVTRNLATWGESIDYDGGMGTFWLANLAGDYGLRVTYTCGNNHSSHVCNNFYPLCTD